ncbi:MAG: sugar nucleotide-binding protein [bacterium]|nr:sugar nucleotide-binding protein [bacterium]
MKILICGNGWIGNILKDFLGAEMSDRRLQDIGAEIVSKYDVVINCAGKTNIDWCEKNKAEALAINAIDSSKLARVCQKLGKKYVFISSACIFESVHTDDWKDEYSTPNPGCFYSVSKVVAEHLVLEACPDALIIRIRLPISQWPHPRNTLTKILGYSALHTNQETVTVVEDMLPVLDGLIKADEKGVFHLVNEGTISPMEMRASLEIQGDYKAIRKEDMDKELRKAGRAKRVSTLVLSTRIAPLPSISSRMPQIARAYKEHLSYKGGVVI